MAEITRLDVGTAVEFETWAEFAVFHIHTCTHPLSTFRLNALQQISSWMTANLLTLNSFKTEFLLIGLKAT